jgi:hypothetical protein
MTTQEQIKTIETIFEGSEITVHGTDIYVGALDTDALIRIYLDTENEFYSITELLHINDMPLNTTKFNSFDEVIEFIEENY